VGKGGRGEDGNTEGEGGRGGEIEGKGREYVRAGVRMGRGEEGWGMKNLKMQGMIHHNLCGRCRPRSIIKLNYI